MKITGWRTATLALVPAAVLTAGLAAPAAASPQAAAADTSVSGTSTLTAEASAAGAAAKGARVAAADALAAYWTADRMRAAVPVEQAPFYRAALAKAESTPAAAGQSQPQGKAGKVAPSAPQASSPLAKHGQAPGASGDASAAVAPDLPPSHPTARTSGKVFFTKSGVNYVCSGSIVNSEGKDTVWTAGHCVHGGSGGTWHSNWQFVPAYKNGAAPWGVWSSRQLWTKSSWISSSDFTSDMGVSIMNTRLGWNIVSYLGGNGMLWNGPKSRGIISLGYPAEAPYNGQVLRYCIATSAQRSFFSPQDIKLACDMTRGSSGGAWLANYDGYWGYLNGVVSRINRIVGPTESYSGYFDDSASSLYQSTRYL